MIPGSSPLTRGKPSYWLFVRLRRGLIPAHAGKTDRCPPRSRARPAHPRSRGENGWPERHIKPNQGSSPLTRGKRMARAPHQAQSGLIPAHAGKTTRHTPSQSRPGAHPRSRGENGASPARPADEGGSSPLTRGKQCGAFVDETRAGLIPAHAGKTRNRIPTCRYPRAHPRSRGENLEPFNDDTHGGGSSPLTRGKPHAAWRAGTTFGLIPAHAGKTAPSTSSPWAGWAHPRSRGENPPAFPEWTRGRGSSPLTRGKQGVAVGATGVVGSSPLTRGKLRAHRVPKARLRLIPAHAGKTTAWTHFGYSLGAHPRSRGENIECRPECDADDGSSPLTRGKLPRARGLFVCPGLIPAHAGKTRSERRRSD